MMPIEARLKEAEDTLRECSKAFDGAKIWGGMDWVLSPLHPIKYKKARDLVKKYWLDRQRELDEISK